MKLSLRLSVLVVVSSVFCTPGLAQDRVVNPNYEQASKFDSAYLRQRTYSSSVSPNWIGETDRFWYSYKTSAGTRYYLVDPGAGTRTHLFDHEAVASALSLAVKQPLESSQLSLGRAKINDEGTELTVTVEKKGFTIELATGKVTARETKSDTDNDGASSSESRRRSYRGRSNSSEDGDEKKPVDPRAHRGFSPDRTAYVFMKEHNLYYVEASEEVQAEVKAIDARMKKEKREKAKAEAAKAEADKTTTGKEDKGEESDKDGETKDGKKQEEKISEITDEGTEKKGDVVKDEGKEKVDKKEDGDSKKDGGDDDEKSKDDGKDKEEEDKDGDKDKDKEEEDKDGDKDKKKEPEKKVDEREAWADDVDESQALQLTENGEEDYEFSSSRYRGPQGQLDVGQEAYLDILQTGEFEDFLPGDDDKKDDDKKDGDKKDDDKKDGDSEGTEEEDEKPEEPKKSRPSVTWSQDSTAFYATRRDSRDVEELFLVNSLSTPRPTLESYSYPLPGEENIRRSELYVFDRTRKTLFRVDPVWKDEGYSNVHWGKTVTRDKDDDEKKEGAEAEEEEELDFTGTGDTLRFLRRDRLVRNVEFCSLDTRTSECTTLIDEGFQRANISTQSVRYLKERDELIWWSERSGWGHFYLYSRDGEFKNAITSGPFRASRIVEVDEDKGLLYFRGNAREDGENLYYDHLYRVFLDGSGLTLLDPGNATHRSNLSPTRKFLVDNCSRVDMAPISRVCDAEGNEVMHLEESDLSRLYAAGWVMPETFTFKAADGITDLYGNLWKPFDFDPKKKYAVIAEVYPGPQMEGVSHSFSTSHGRQQLAQLGFLVVQLGHRGGTPGRSKAYHSYGYFNLRDYGLADKKAGIEQLAEQRPYVDINRIGIYGHSGGGFMTAAALMQEPYNDFFKVGVSSSGNHDNNVYGYYWAERYHGLREVEVEKKEQQRSRSGGRGQGEVEARDDEDDDKEKKDDKKVEGDGQKKDGEKDGEKGDDDGEKKDGEETEEEEAETRFQIQVPSNAELAANLKGHLLLVHGDMDNNVHPAGTMRLVDALIRENKRFDMLIFPGKRHGYGEASSYFTQRKWDYFVEHLMGHSPDSADIKNKD